MKTWAVIGEAGTGKTHRLMQAALEFPEGEPFEPGQKVLGLTFMHGSRRRMKKRLAHQGGKAPPYRVSTLDSFAIDLVRRFRRYCGLEHGEIRVTITDSEAAESRWKLQHGSWRASLDTVRLTAADLLESEAVQATVRAAFPLVIIDEIQDCRGPLLPMVCGLATITSLVGAGDPFQDLGGSESNAAVEWLKQAAGKVVNLEEQHRTTDASVLTSASSLRRGSRSEGAHVEVVECPGYGLVAWEIQKRIVWDSWEGSAALITPARPDSSPYVRKVLKSLTGWKGKRKNLPPTPFHWEGTVEEKTQAAIQEVCGGFGEEALLTAQDLRAVVGRSDAGSRAKKVCLQVLRRMRLTGRTEIGLEQVEEAVGLQAHAERVYRSSSDDSGRRAMTVHGAKNREFDNVFVVWPYQVVGNEEMARRLLYNAITRARHRAVVLVQGEGRISKDAALSCISA